MLPYRRFVQVINEEDPIAKKLGAREFPAVVGLLSTGEQFHPDDVIFEQSLSKSVGALRSFLEKLEKRDRDLERMQISSEPITYLTKKNMKRVCGSESPLCIIAASRSSKGAEKVKQILTEVCYPKHIQRFLIPSLFGHCEFENVFPPHKYIFASCS